MDKHTQNENQTKRGVPESALVGTTETVTIERMATGPEGIAHLASGLTVFVDGAAPGDVARIEIRQDKGSFARASIVELLEASSVRVRPTCPYGDVCGGCPWQHLDYQVQLDAKRDNVIAALTHTAHVPLEKAQSLVAPVCGSKRQWGYRNKLELNAYNDEHGKFQLGFAQEGSHQFFSPDTCPIAVKSIQKAPKALRGALRYLQGANDLGIYRVGVRASVRTRDVEVALWTNSGPFPRTQAAKMIQGALKPSSVVRVIADPGRARKIKNVEMLSGKGCWEEELYGNRFLTSAPAFFQVNTAQAEKLIELVLAGLEIGEDSYVADLYSGGGTFSIPLAATGAEVVAVESVGASVRDLRRNAERAGVFVDVIGGDAAREIQELEDLDALVVDPPRAGLAKGVAEDIAAAGPARVAYVSCNPQTWARDVVRLEAVGYRLLSVQPVDMFPQTFHCEIVSIFAR